MAPASGKILGKRKLHDDSNEKKGALLTGVQTLDSVAAEHLYASGSKDAVSILEQLQNRGFVKFPSGVPWEWELVKFVEELHACYHEEIERRLVALQGQWAENDVGWRLGSSAAQKVSAEMESSGIAVYTPPVSQGDAAPYSSTGPRFYVSVTAAAWQRWPEGAPPPCEGLARILWPHSCDGELADGEWPNMIRGLGWALAPPRSDPQTLHADIWGDRPRPGRVRFHHILWKRLPGENCTTQLVPGGFTDGRTDPEVYAKLESASAPCLLYDNEVLHRGAANTSDRWVSTCSIELCTRTGFNEVWKGGSEDDGIYKMLPICWKS